jgi:hypothetical protein
METAFQERAVQAVEGAAIAGQHLLDLMAVDHPAQVIIHGAHSL